MKWINRYFCRFIYWLVGWKVNGVKPADLKKYIIIVVPHTSNWDFPHGLLTRPLIHSETSKFLIKKSWVDSPIGFLMNWWGAVPVDRSEKRNMVEQMVDALNDADELGLCIAPEGSRSAGKEWKSGFYHIAHQAKVPIMCVYFDYYKRETGVAKILETTGDYEADLKELQDAFVHRLPKIPAKSSLEHIKPTDFKRSIWFYVKPFVRILLFIALIFLAFNWELVAYGLGQANGQLKIIREAEPIEVFLNDANYPEDKKIKIRYIQEVRQYAFDSLGLDKTDSYTKIYDQKGKALLWNVTACEPYKLKAVEWTFPLIGSFSYKGFFDQEKAEETESELKKKGYDTDIREVGGWSTLGILNDPILSEMLNRNEGSLANLIIHELTHGTIFIKNGVQYNENLASFVGDYGALRFLHTKYGEGSDIYQNYAHSKSDSEIFSKYVIKSAKNLIAIYDSEMSQDKMEDAKQKHIKRFVSELKELPFYNQGYKNIFKDEQPNNTFFMSRMRYRAKQNEFREEFENEFDSNFPKYLAHLKEKYGSMF